MSSIDLRNEVLAVVQSPYSSVSDLEELVCKDPQFAAKILTKVNSSTSTKRRVQSVGRAIALLGFENVKTLAMA